MLELIRDPIKNKMQIAYLANSYAKLAREQFWRRDFPFSLGVDPISLIAQQKVSAAYYEAAMKYRLLLVSE